MFYLHGVLHVTNHENISTRIKFFLNREFSLSTEKSETHKFKKLRSIRLPIVSLRWQKQIYFAIGKRYCHIILFNLLIILLKCVTIFIFQREFHLFHLLKKRKETL